MRTKDGLLHLSRNHINVAHVSYIIRFPEEKKINIALLYESRVIGGCSNAFVLASQLRDRAALLSPALSRKNPARFRSPFAANAIQDRLLSTARSFLAFLVCLILQDVSVS